jgi:hypothetical protein
VARSTTPSRAATSGLLPRRDQRRARLVLDETDEG